MYVCMYVRTHVRTYVRTDVCDRFSGLYTDSRKYITFIEG